MSGAAIETEGLGKSYGERRGIDGLSLRVSGGEVFGFLGPNGAGKSTTIRLLLGFMRPSAGRASVFGLDCWSQSAKIKEEVGYVPGDLRLPSWLAGREALKIFGSIRRRDLSKPGAELAERLQLDLDLPSRAMSRGTRQKLGLVLALAHKPKLLVLDEPTSALDPPTQRALLDHLRGRANDGAAVFFSSHVISEVESVCDRVAVLRDGRLAACDSLSGLKSQASRHAALLWKTEKDAKEAKPPAFLERLRRDGRQWRADLTGHALEFMAWASKQPLEDASVGPPDLETLFQRFYEDDDGAGAASGEGPAAGEKDEAQA